MGIVETVQEEHDHFRLSRFAHVFRTNHNLALFNTKSMEVVYYGPPLENIVSGFAGQEGISGEITGVDGNTIQDFLRTLHDSEMIVRKDDLENVEIPPEIDAINPDLLRFLITFNCNLACQYCQIITNVRNEHPSNRLTKDEIDAAFKLFMQYSAPHRTVSISGGEPLVALDLVKYIVEKTEQMLPMDDTRLVISTNGTLINPKTAAYLASKKMLVLVSLDGKEEHNVFRLSKQGTNQYDKIMNGITLLKDAGCTLGISMTIGTQNVRDARAIAEFVATKIRPQSVGYNFIHYPSFDPHHTTLPSIDEYCKALIEIFTTLRSYGIYDDQFFRRLEPFVTMIPRTKECSALGSAINVIPGGKIGPCKTLLASQNYYEDLGKVVDVSQSKVFRYFANRSVYTLEQCQPCEASSVCGGSCSFDVYVLHGDIYGVDERNCYYMKKALEFMIWDLFQGIAKSDPGPRMYLRPTPEQRKILFGGIRVNDLTLNSSVGHKNK